MKQIMIVGLIVIGFIACNDNGTNNAGNASPDSAYNNPPATDTGQGMSTDSTDSTVKPGAGSGSGSSIQAGQDTGSGSKKQ
jgi:hypothetical protein